MNGASVQVPAGWIVAPDPPPGVALVAFAPDPPVDGAVRPNLVVTMVDRPPYDDVDGYLDAVLGELLLGHDRAELLELWTTDEPESVPPTLGQRLVVQHHAGDVAVWLVQQHTWVDDVIVVVTVTVPADAPTDLLDVLVGCLDPAPVAA